MRKLRHMISMIRPNWMTFAGFEILFKLMTGVLFPPLFRFLFSQVLRLSGVRFLTAENSHVVFRNPLTWISLALLLLLYSYQALIELGGLIFITDQSEAGCRTNIWQTVRFTFLRTSKIVRRDQFGILLLVLLLTPVFHFVTAINMLWTYSIMGRVLRFIRRHFFLGCILTAMFLFFLVTFIRWRYSVHYYMLDQDGAVQAAARSRRLARKKGVRPVVSVLGFQAVLSAGYLLLIAVVLLVSTVLHRLLHLPGAGVSTFQVVFLNLAVSFFDALTVIVLVLLISLSFYESRQRRKTGAAVSGRRESSRQDTETHEVSRLRVIEFWLFLAAAALGGFMLMRTSRGRYSLRIENLNTMQVTAHRGASMHYPENTMAAFAGAVEQGTDWIELDVQESLDGQIFVMHDSSFLRTTGVNRYAWELEYDEIAGLDAGSSFSPEYKNERIPLLRDVLEFAKETDVRLNIELKPGGQEKNLVAGVIALVEEAGFEDRCVITSQAYRVLQDVKQINDQIETVYVMGLAYGAINRLKDADAFSIRSTSISRSLVKDLHNRGIQVYAWTVDSRKNINRMINMGVDNIITNNVPLAIECINDSRKSSIVMELIKSVRELF